jgi:lipid-binding SYLF domain-containing protein
MQRLAVLLLSTFAFLPGAAIAQEVKDFSPSIEIFKSIPGVKPYFDSAYGYAVWRTIARGGLGVGAATGRGQVYVGGNVVGFSRLIDISIGLQAGGQAYKQVIFFANKAAYDKFAGGNFEFSAQASAVAVTASAQATAGTQGSQASAGAGEPANSAVAGGYQDGVQVFTMATGGLMYQATIAGQKYGFKPIK